MYFFNLHDQTKCVEIVVQPKKSNVPKDFLEDLRKEFPRITIQIIAVHAVYSPEHLMWVVRQSWLAKARASMLARRVEIDILMRLAGSSQIANAIKVAGAKKGSAFVVLGIGTEEDLHGLATTVERKCSILQFPYAGTKEVLARFKITEKEIGSSGKGKEPLILAEKGLLAVLEKL